MVAIGLLVALMALLGLGLLLVLGVIGVVAEARNVRAVIAAGLPPELPLARIHVRGSEW
jgi:hypothetical protein